MQRLYAIQFIIERGWRYNLLPNVAFSNLLSVCILGMQIAALRVGIILYCVRMHPRQ